MNTKKQQIYRQGDVLIERIASIPTDAKKAEPENGRIILAHGEVTGHNHSFDLMDCESSKGPDGTDYFNIRGRKFDCALPIVRRWKNQVMVNHHEFGMIEFSVQDVSIQGDSVMLKGNYGLLKHQEHTFQGIPSGTYKGAVSGSVRQLEYSPEAIRNVAD